MKMNYCDLCGCPIKGDNSYVMYIAKSNSINITNENDYYNYLKKLEKEVKEICPQCKLIIEEIFKLRYQNLNQISLELLGIYQKESKEPPKKRE